MSGRVGKAATRGDISDAKGLDRWHDFMRASGRVFFESVIEGSDLFPMRCSSWR